MSLKVWLPLNGSSENKGASSIVLSSGGTITYTAGKIGNAATFNSGRLNSTVNLSMSPISACCWVYLNTNITDLQYMVSLNATAGFVDHAVGLAIENSKIYYVVGGDYTIQATPTLNTWMHIAVTYDGSTIKGYLNGVEVGSKSGVTQLSNKTRLTIGARYNDNNSYTGYLKGKLNDVRIYDHCLSAAEVHEIAQGLMLHYKLDSFAGGYGNPNLLKNSRTFGTGWSGMGTITQNAFKGFAVRYQDNSSGTGYADIAVYNNVLTVNPNEVYTASFWAKADTAHNVLCYFYNNASGVVQCLNGTASTGATTTSADGSMNIALTTDWKYYWITWTFKSSGTATNKSLIIGRNLPNGSGVSIAQVKLERGNSATPWAPHSSDGEPVQSIIKDSSGYGYDGTITGSITLSNDTKRYNSCASIGSASTCLTAQSIGTSENKFSFNIWCNPSSMPAGAKYFNVTLNSTMHFNFGCTSGGGTSCQFLIFNGSNYKGPNGEFTIPINEWHMWTGTYDGTTVKLYKDGELVISKTEASSYSMTIPNKWYFLGTGTNAQLGLASDIRLYCTTLSADDIKELYNVEARVDKRNNIHSYTFSESDAESISNTGIVTGHGIFESPSSDTLRYDKTIYTEADGSKWVRIFHHNNPAGGLFTNGSAWEKGVYVDANRWFDIYGNVELAPKYELMVKQKTTSSASEVKYRWIQNVSPLTATWDDVKPASVTRITTSGYTDGSNGGLYITNSNTHMVIANSNNGNWYGATGSWTTYSGGIPGYPNSVITSGYMDIYIRVYQNVKIKKNIGFSAEHLIEM